VKSLKVTRASIREACDCGTGMSEASPGTIRSMARDMLRCRALDEAVAQKRSYVADEKKEAGRSRSRESYLLASALLLLNRCAISALPSDGTLQSLLYSTLKCWTYMKDNFGGTVHALPVHYMRAFMMLTCKDEKGTSATGQY
jgi:hypothetical protein